MFCRAIEMQGASSSVAQHADKAPAFALAEDEEDEMADLHSRVGSAQLPQGGLEDEVQRPPLVHWPMHSDQVLLSSFSTLHSFNNVCCQFTCLNETGAPINK